MKTSISRIALLAAGVFYSSFLAAQNDSGAATVPPQPVMVNSVSNISPEHPGELRMEEYLRVNVSNLQYWLWQHRSDTAKIVLYMDGIPMTGLKALFYDSCNNAVFFHMERSTGTDPWDVFYCSPCHWEAKDMPVSIGYNGDCMLTSKAKVNFIIINAGYFWIASLVVIVLLMLFWYALKRGLLKDECVLPLPQKPYSLSRTQLAVWTMIVAVSYIFIALVTGELVPLSTSTLILLGISGATAAAGNVIDNSDKTSNNSRHQDNYTSNGFLNDILCDANGVSVHRFQMVVFNIILCIFFIIQVFTSLKMPDFDNNLLILMGLSNTTYAGLKANENKNNNGNLPATVPNNIPPVTNIPPVNQ